MSSTSCMCFCLTDKRWSGTLDNFQPLPTGEPFFSHLFCSCAFSSSSLASFFPLSLTSFHLSLLKTPRHTLIKRIFRLSTCCIIPTQLDRLQQNVCWLIISGQAVTDAAMMVGSQFSVPAQEEATADLQKAQAGKANLCNIQAPRLPRTRGGIDSGGGRVSCYIQICPVCMCVCGQGEGFSHQQ